jgi:hypothetical protein
MLKETDQAALGAFGPVCVLYLKGAAVLWPHRTAG